MGGISGYKNQQACKITSVTAIFHKPLTNLITISPICNRAVGYINS